MTKSRNTRLALVSGLTLGLLALVLGFETLVAHGSDPTASERANLPTKFETSLENRSVAPDTIQVVQSLNVKGVGFSLVRYESSDGPCLDVYADVVPEAAPGQSGCGAPDGPFHWSIGGLDIGGTWYNIAYGDAVPNSEIAKIETTEGLTMNAAVVDGTWIFVVPGDRIDYTNVTLVDAAGDTLASDQLPSLLSEEQKANSMD